MQPENTLHLGDRLRVLVRIVAGRDDEFTLRGFHVAAPIWDDAVAHHRFRLVLVTALSAVAADDVVRDAGRDRDFL
jgi:hypothetical protein